MSSYKCPVCGTKNVNGYLRCNRPDCTDGRDHVPYDDDCVYDPVTGKPKLFTMEEVLSINSK